MEETEELEDLARFRGNFVDTMIRSANIRVTLGRNAPPNTNDKVHLSLRRDVEIARGTGSTLETELLLLRSEILLHVLLRALEDDLALRLSCLQAI